MMAVAMERAARLGMPVLSHCEEMTLVRGGIMLEGVVSEELGVPGIHRGAEEVATAREIALAGGHRLSGAYLPCQHGGERGAAAGRTAARRAGDGGDSPPLFRLD